MHRNHSVGNEQPLSLVEHGTAYIFPPQEFDIIHAVGALSLIRENLVTPTIERVIVSLDEVDFIDAAGMNTLVEGQFIAREQGKYYAVSNDGPAAQRFHRLFIITKLNHMLNFYPPTILRP